MPESGRGGSANRAYWRANLRLLAVLMSIWALVSFGAGIVFREWLDQFFLGGYPLGFWFAQQGSIYVFIALIFVYSWAIRRIERRYALDDDDASEAPPLDGPDAGENPAR